MRLSPLFAFVTSALWASATDLINEYIQWNNSLPKRELEDSTYNQYIHWDHHNIGHRIFVTSCDGVLVRAYRVGADEKYYIVGNHYDTVARHTIMSQNRDGKQETYVLTQHGLYTYTVDPRSRYQVRESYDPNVRTITYHHKFGNKKFTREIGPDGKPVKTVIVFPDGRSETIDPIASSHHEPHGTVQRRGNPMAPSSRLPQVPPSRLYNAHIYWSWVGQKHHIHVIAYDGQPLRTYVVDANEEHYIVFRHSNQHTEYAVVSQSLSFQLVTQVLGAKGRTTYFVQFHTTVTVRKLESSTDTLIEYNHNGPAGRKYLRKIAVIGRPVRTFIRISDEYGDVVDYNPVPRQIIEADYIVN